MGVQLTELLRLKEISINELISRIIAVDSSIFLYQFITTIRQRDGTPLMDSKGNITSHLTGLFTRTSKLIQQGIKLVYVFDGKPPELKQKERERRKDIKIESEKRFKEAVKKQDIAEMKKYAARTSRLTPQMIEESKKLVSYFGLPIIEAPSEGEAQAAYLVKNNDAFAVASQDADCLLFGSSRLVRNLSIAGKRKKTNKLAYETVKPEIADLSDNLNHLGIDQDQLIVLAMLIGTDYNPGGIKGIGPKNAFKLIKEYRSNFDRLFEDVKWHDNFDFPWTDVFYLIKKMPVTDKYKLEWGSIDKEKITKLLVDNHDFSEERVNLTLNKLADETSSKKQKSLFEF